jgi:hypothetical protein
MKCLNKNILVILLSVLFFNCSNRKEKSFDIDLALKEGKENLPFQGEYSDFEKTLTFELYKLTYQLEMSFENRTVDYFKKLDKKLTYNSNQKPENPNEAFYNMFLNDSEDLYLLEGLMESIRNRTVGEEVDMVQLLVALVQSIPYEIAATQKYPYETLYLNKGDCSDKSILLCKLLILEGYDACLFVYDKAEHMAVGLKVSDEQEFYYSGYTYIESTAISPIGDIPDELVGGVKIDEEPEIIYPYENGVYKYEDISDLKLFYKQVAKKYGNSFLQSSIKEKKYLEEIKFLSVKIDSLKLAQSSTKNTLDSLKKESSKKGCNGVVSKQLYNECIEINDTINVSIKKFNQLNLDIINLNKIYNNKIRVYNSKME